MDEELLPIPNCEVEKSNEPIVIGSRQVGKCIQQIIDTVNQYNLTAQQLRYCFKQVRNKTGLKTPVRPKKLPTYLVAGEIYKLLENAYRMSKKHGLICEILIFLGLRINELRNLDVRDIQENNQVLIRHGKGSKQRMVPISNNLLQKLKLYLGDRKVGYIFLNRYNKQYSIRMLEYMVTDALKSCEFDKNLHTHSLRHTFGCLCMSKGMSLETIQVMMGHSHRATTEIYARLELGSVKEQYLQLMGGH